MKCRKMDGVLEEIKSISRRVEEDLQLAIALEKLAPPNGDAAIHLLASTLKEYLENLPDSLYELRDIVEGITTEGCAI